MVLTSADRYWRRLSIVRSNVTLNVTLDFRRTDSNVTLTHARSN